MSYKWMIGLALAAAVLTAGCQGSGAVSSHDHGHAHGHDHARQLRHVVFFKFQEGVTEAQIREVELAFAALADKIDQIEYFEWGTNVSPEGLDWGYTHCFLVSFANEAARDAYLVHPAHQEFVALAVPRLEKPHVIDYFVRR